MNTTNKNPFTWVEIYVEDMPRAQKFYESVFKIQMTEMPMPEGVTDMQMVGFPWAEDVNISGALVKSADFAPYAGGTLTYFACEDCAVEESRVAAAGGKVLQPKMPIGEHGFCAVIMDTEGNAVGLHSRK